MTDNADILITEKLVMKNCKLTFEEAEGALWELTYAEIVDLDYTEGKRKYKALMTRADYDLFWELLTKKHLSNDANGCYVKKNALGNYDLMSGLEFENFCITVMERIGFFMLKRQVLRETMALIF